MALSKRARGYAISTPVVTALLLLYFTVPAFQSKVSVVFGWIKSFRQWKQGWSWVIVLGVIGLVGLLCGLAILARWYVAGMVKREEVRTGRTLEASGSARSNRHRGTKSNEPVD